MIAKLYDTLPDLYYVDGFGNIQSGSHEGLSGTINIEGDCSYVCGVCRSDLRGDISGLQGDLTGIYGNPTGLIGNLDTCGITQEDRESGVDISTLVVR